MRCLNLGCGQRFHPEWVNLDLHPWNPSVRVCDLRKDLPFSEGSFDAVYHSHVLEHFSRADGSRFLGECHRVLRPGGIIRVAVPDLEKIARLYIEALDRSLAGDSTWQSRYEWILLEMYDQTVRRASGGEMLSYLSREPVPERDFIARRLGGEFDRIVAHVARSTDDEPRKSALSLRQRISRKLAELALGREGLEAHDRGIFQLSGENHLWMYDRYSLAQALEKSGFTSPRSLGAAESAIPDWTKFNLDTEPDGRIYKPDSLFMEATRA
ncbi:MAG: methyltransferase domain-containing protein [Candidatus Acidiferrum sp.]